ncbi:hypothetical protein [Ruegeria sp. HKCCA4812]|uniref:hypothetical protein n=1 Tax=Ruegeria sp. HKCCA4812 TaxID=2682993 RepID=UPI001489A1E9|nr:hypothetical protein [Ruegeria sp. HKCCA4812]
MTDISKEAVERLIKEDLTEIAISAGLKVTDHDVKVMEQTADMLRALSARVEELEQQVRDTLKISNLKREQGRLQGLDEAIAKCRQRDIIYADSAAEHIQALKEQSND